MIWEEEKKSIKYNRASLYINVRELRTTWSNGSIWEEAKEWNERNYFGIFISFRCLTVLIERTKNHSFFWKFK